MTTSCVVVTTTQVPKESALTVVVCNIRKTVRYSKLQQRVALYYNIRPSAKTLVAPIW